MRVVLTVGFTWGLEFRALAGGREPGRGEGGGGGPEAGWQLAGFGVEAKKGGFRVSI